MNKDQIKSRMAYYVRSCGKAKATKETKQVPEKRESHTKKQGQSCTNYHLNRLN